MKEVFFTPLLKRCGRKPIVTGFTIFLFLSLFSVAFAQTDSCDSAWYCNPLRNVRDIPTLFNNIANASIALAIPIATFTFVWIGVRFLASAHQPTKLAEVKKHFWWVLIGLAIIVAASIAAKVIANFLGKKPNARLPSPFVLWR